MYSCPASRNRIHTCPPDPSLSCAQWPLTSSASNPLDELTPSPQRVILAVAAAEPFESTWVLPKVRLVEEFWVANVFAAKQPRADFVNTRDADDTLSLEVPRKWTNRAQPKGTERHATRKPFPGVAGSRYADDQPKEWQHRRAKHRCDDRQFLRPPNWVHLPCAPDANVQLQGFQ